MAPTVWHQLHVRPEIRLVDLAVYRAAGESLLTGRPVYSYLIDPPQLLPFTYPPIAAIFAMPLAMLPWTFVQWAWTTAQLVMLVAVVVIAMAPLRGRLGAAWPLAVGSVVAAASWLLPIRDNIRYGQVNLALILLVLLDCAVRRPRWPRGALIGLATAVKLTPGVFVPYLWLTGRRRAAVVAAGTAVALTAAAFAVAPENSLDYWAGALYDSERLGINANTSNQSIRGMLLRTPLHGGLLATALVAALTVVAVVGYRRARAFSLAGDEVAGVTVVGLLAVLLSPVAWIHHLAWVVLVLVVLLGDLRSLRRIVAAAAVGLFFGFALPWYGRDWINNGHPLVVGVPLRDAYGLAAVALVATLPSRAARSRA